MRVLLRHRETNATAEGILCRLNHDHFTRAQASWLEAFDRRSQAGLRNDDVLLWKHGFMSTAPPRGHVIMSDGRIEGLVVTSAEPQPSRIDSSASLVYVQYLATAPWNRIGLGPECGFLGIGRLLVARAVLDSVSRGYDGRIGLHSFPAATAFYDSLGFECLGTDPIHRGMTLFELSPKAAVLALAELGAHLIHNPELL